MSQSLSQQFLTWCRSKPADEEYPFLSIRDCACSQFGRELGLLADGEPFGASDALDTLHCRNDAALRTRPWTFGALADRLEVALS